MWFMVCRWPQSHEGDWARPHLCKLALHGPWPARKRFIRDRVWRGRSKPGCLIVGSVTIVWLTTEADHQSSLYCLIESTDVVSVSKSFSKLHERCWPGTCRLRVGIALDARSDVPTVSRSASTTSSPAYTVIHREETVTEFKIRCTINVKSKVTLHR